MLTVSPLHRTVWWGLTSTCCGPVLGTSGLLAPPAGGHHRGLGNLHSGLCLSFAGPAGTSPNPTGLPARLLPTGSQPDLCPSALHTSKLPRGRGGPLSGDRGVSEARSVWPLAQGHEPGHN